MPEPTDNQPPVLKPVCSRCGADKEPLLNVPDGSEEKLCKECYEILAAKPAPEAPAAPVPSGADIEEASPPPVIGEPQPVNTGKLCRLETWRRAGRVVRVDAPADGSPAEFFVIATIVLQTPDGRQMKFEMVKFIAECRSVEEAFERWEKVAEAGKQDFMAAHQVRQPKIQVPAMNIPPEVFGRGGRPGPGRGNGHRRRG